MTSHVCAESACLVIIFGGGSKIVVMTPDYIVDLKRRHQALENEIAETLRYCSNDDLLIVDLKLRLMYLRDELRRFYNEIIPRYSLF